MHAEKTFHGKSIGRKKTVFALTIIIFLLSMVFSFGSITGNVIGNLNQESSKWVSAALFILGMVVVLGYLQRKK